MNSLTRYALVIVLISLFAACRNKKKEEPKNDSLFPALSFIRSQVAHVDTSFYPITRIVVVDSTHSDTTYFKREEFASLAADFLSVPDISDPSFAKRYTEERIFDQSLNLAILTSKPVNPENELIQRQEVLIRPDAVSGDKVKNIIIEYAKVTKDSSIQKKMMWKTDNSFQVATTVQLPGQPEKTTTCKVTWNDEEQP